MGVCVDLIVVPKILRPTIWRVAIVFSKLTLLPLINPSRNAWLEWNETPCPELKNVVTVKWHVTVMIRKKNPPVHVRVPVRIHSVLRTVCVETIAVSKVMNLRIPMTVLLLPLRMNHTRMVMMPPNWPAPIMRILDPVPTVRDPVVVIIPNFWTPKMRVARVNVIPPTIPSVRVVDKSVVMALKVPKDRTPSSYQPMLPLRN